LEFFLSHDLENQRSILREILRGLSTWTDKIIVSGTGVSMKDLTETLDSSVSKDRSPHALVTRIGAFDHSAAQEAYLEQYFPPGFLDTEPGKVLLSRIGYWLHGR
jgi:hypothetical protein